MTTNRKQQVREALSKILWTLNNLDEGIDDKELVSLIAQAHSKVEDAYYHIANEKAESPGLTAEQVNDAFFSFLNK